jgi:hypothetical protein
LEEEISTNPDKVKTVQDWPRPKTPKQMRGFIGLCPNLYDLNHLWILRKKHFGVLLTILTM